MEMMTMEEELAELMEKDWKVSEKDIKMASAELENFFKVMRSSDAEKITGQPFTPKDEKMWAIKRATDRKIYLTVMWFRTREIIAAVVVAATVFFWLSPLNVSAAVLFAAIFAAIAYILSHILRPDWSYRLYHDRGMYHESSLADAFYGRIKSLTIEEWGVRPSPAWITRFID